jgi:hypothetical protein
VFSFLSVKVDSVANLHKGSLVWDSRESVDWFDEDSFILPNIAG